ncbi:MAG: hypothetical protein RJA80_1168, partial [Actinomycetota bacterium]
YIVGEFHIFVEKHWSFLRVVLSKLFDFIYENDLVTVLVQKEFVNIFKILKVNLSADSTSTLESYE